MHTTIGVSNRHVHLNKETYKKLFGDMPLIERNPLNQPGQFASTYTVDLKLNDKVMEHVRLIGPIRNYNQVELSETDASFFNITPPRRQSGDLDGTEGITIIGPCGEVTIESGVILAERHIHMTSKMAALLNLEDKTTMSVYKDDNYLFDAIIKYSDPGYFEIHIDKDEASKYNLESGDGVEIKICGK